MARLNVLIPNPSREEITAARAALTKQGFGSLSFGDLTRHHRGQHLDGDIVVVEMGWPQRTERVKQDCSGRVVVVEDIAGLARVQPDRTTRPTLEEAKAPDAVWESGDRLVYAESETGNGHAEVETDDGEPAGGEAPPPTRSALFRRAREAGVSVKVSMTNDDLAAAVAAAEQQHGARQAD